MLIVLFRKKPVNMQRRQLEVILAWRYRELLTADIFGLYLTLGSCVSDITISDGCGNQVKVLL